jgi:phage shock protein A
MQARSGALDELLESGALDEIGTGGGDDIQRELDQLGASSGVEAELAALKASTAPPAQALGAGTAAPEDTIQDAEVVEGGNA